MQIEFNVLGGVFMKMDNVVSFEREADFYFDLSFKYQQNGKLKSALRYIEKAVKIKPKDSIILFSYAGFLSELGHIDHSSKILLRIINNIDPNYEECYFGLGCNYLQVQKMKKSLFYFEKYIKLAPFGEFAEEAENMVDMLNLIREANNNLDDDELERIYKVEEKGMKFLEKKEYEKALIAFKEVIDRLPNATPAKNNLSLTYYYLGKTEKAVEMAQEVIKNEPFSVHANSNLCIFYNKMGRGSLLERQIRIVRKIIVDNEEYAYKIADTFACVGRHKDAYIAYKRLLRFDKHNPQYIHYVATAAFNCKKYKEALLSWKKIKEVEDSNYLCDYYFKQIMDIEDGKKDHKPLPYSKVRSKKLTL